MAMANLAPRCSCIVGRRNVGGSASDGWRIEKRKQESVETCRHFFPSSPCDTHLHGTLFLWSGESLMHMSSLAETAIGVWGWALDLRLTAESFPLYLSPALTPALGLPCCRERGVVVIGPVSSSSIVASLRHARTCLARGCRSGERAMAGAPCVVRQSNSGGQDTLALEGCLAGRGKLQPPLLASDCSVKRTTHGRELQPCAACSPMRRGWDFQLRPACCPSTLEMPGRSAVRPLCPTFRCAKRRVCSTFEHLRRPSHCDLLSSTMRRAHNLNTPQWGRWHSVSTAEIAHCLDPFPSFRHGGFFNRGETMDSLSSTCGDRRIVTCLSSTMRRAHNLNTSQWGRWHSASIAEIAHCLDEIAFFSG